MNIGFTEILDHCRQQLQKGVTGQGHAFKNMTVSTHGSDTISSCTVVLRAVDRANNEIIFYTDARSEKISNIRRNNHITALFYDNEAKLQLILKGKATLHNQDELTTEHFATLNDNGKKAYMAQPGPSSKINTPADGLEYINPQNNDQALKDAYRNFTVISIKVNFLEYLKLNRNGHRRASFTLSGDDWQGQWLVP